jgi:hypothetical protein
VADYCAYARSNYFRVKNLEAFDKFVKRIDGTLIERKGSVGFICNELVPSDRHGEEGESDFLEELKEYLLDGEVAIVQEVGWEKLRYLFGAAWAITPGKEIISVMLSDIYAQVKREWQSDDNVSDCSD